jgi:hypothetical protein
MEPQPVPETIRPPKKKTTTRRRAGSASGKRRCISTACIACRKRKSKCDGALPSCAACASVYGTECIYDPNSDHRRKGVYREKVDSMKARSSTLQILIEAILNAAEDDVPAIVHRIRTCDSLDTVAEYLINQQQEAEKEAEEEKKDEQGDWPLKAEPKSPTMPGRTNSYSTMPRISDAPANNTMPNPRAPGNQAQPSQNAQVPDPTEEPQDKKAGCGCCIVM